MKQKISYKDAGVDIEKADQAISSSKTIIQSTFNKNVLSSIGGFGAMYSIKDVVNRYDDPVLVQSIDGVGTKMAVAQKCNNFDFIGCDLVNACCNDVAATGAQPLTFLDYIASSSLDPQTVSEIIKSVAMECKNLGVSLVGGETAEMPGTYAKDKFDLAGFAVGLVEKKKLLTKNGIVLFNRLDTKTAYRKFNKKYWNTKFLTVFPKSQSLKIKGNLILVGFNS